MKPEEITAERIRQAVANQDVILTHGTWYAEPGTGHEKACACPMMVLAMDAGLGKGGEYECSLEDAATAEVAEFTGLPEAWIDGFAWAWDNENKEDYPDRTYSTPGAHAEFEAGYEAGSKVAEELAEEAG